MLFASLNMESGTNVHVVRRQPDDPYIGEPGASFLGVAAPVLRQNAASFWLAEEQQTRVEVADVEGIRTVTTRGEEADLPLVMRRTAVNDVGMTASAGVKSSSSITHSEDALSKASSDG